MTAPAPVKRSPLPLLLVAAVLVLAAAGVGAFFILRSDPAPATAGAGPVAVAGKPAPDLYAQQACDLAWKAVDDDKLMTRDVLAIEEPAGLTADTNIQAAAKDVLEKYRLAVISKTLADGDEVLTEAELLTAAVAMNTTCLEAGVKVG